MLFTINDLGFSIAGLLLEGWLAFAARCVCALALLFIGWVVSRWMQKSLFPRLLKRSWHFAFTHPLLESFARPAARIAWYTGMYLALRSLPWAIPGLAALLLKVYRMMLVFLIGTGFYHASGIAALLLASSSEEVRTNRTLLTLLDKVYKVAVVVLCGATIAQESGLPVGSVVASAGLIGLTISLAAQDMAKNFFSGVVILLDKPFSIGDWITVGDVEGEVVDINFRSTKVRAVDNSIYILTNSTVSSATINNTNTGTSNRHTKSACEQRRDHEGGVQDTEGNDDCGTAHKAAWRHSVEHTKRCAGCADRASDAHSDAHTQRQQRGRRCGC